MTIGRIGAPGPTSRHMMSEAAIIACMDGEGSSLEIEVKLAVGSVAEASGRLARLPATLEHDRRFEDNEVFDTSDGRLSRSDILLRLRLMGTGDAITGIVTYKESVESALNAKVRSELQTSVGCPAAVRDILIKLGFHRVYRYQKYRSDHGWTDPDSGDRLCISLDDTPIGVFLELEGSKVAIDRAAARMGYDESDYIVQDYRSLHRDWLARRGLPSGDMVFT